MSNPEKKTVTFNRRLRASWLAEGLRLATEGLPVEEAEERLKALVSAENSGKDTITKSVRYLRHLWFEPEAAFLELHKEALALYRENPSSETARVLSWGMMLVRYPFVRQVSEAVGRLLRLQEEVQQGQLKRKMKEAFGERETVLRSCRYAVSLLLDYNFVLLKAGSSGYIKGDPLRFEAPKLASWFLQAFFASLENKTGLIRDELIAQPSLFMTNPDQVLKLALTTETFKISRESFSRELIIFR